MSASLMELAIKHEVDMLKSHAECIRTISEVYAHDFRDPSAQSALIQVAAKLSKLQLDLAYAYGLATGEIRETPPVQEPKQGLGDIVRRMRGDDL